MKAAKRSLFFYPTGGRTPGWHKGIRVLFQCFVFVPLTFKQLKHLKHFAFALKKTLLAFDDLLHCIV